MGKSTFLCLFLAIYLVQGDNSPVLIWSSSRSMGDLPQSYIGHKLDTDKFLSDYLNPLSQDPKHSIVLFVQDKLSIEDFTSHADVYNPNSDGGAFKNVKSAMDELFSVQLPAVTSPMSGVEKLKPVYKDRVVKIDSLEDLTKEELPEGQGYLILVTLQPVAGKDAAKALEQNDQMIGQCMHHLNKRGVQYSAIYTAHSSSKREVQVEHKGRHLLEAEEDNEKDPMVFTHNDLVMMSLKSADLVVIKPNPANPEAPLKLSGNATHFSAKGSLQMNAEVIYQANSTDKNDTYLVTISLNNDDGNLTMRFNLSLNYANEWQSGDGNLSYVPNNATSVFDFDKVAIDYQIVAASRFSFHCSSLKPTPVMKYFNKTLFQTIGLTLNGFQIEAFNGNTSEVFTDFVWDCVEFFTVPIWMGIISTTILVLILFFGLTMVANITTMDRFDDPKGKQMTITVNE